VNSSGGTSATQQLQIIKVYDWKVLEASARWNDLMTWRNRFYSWQRTSHCQKLPSDLMEKKKIAF
jgi:hypothetical protein